MKRMVLISLALSISLLSLTSCAAPSDNEEIQDLMLENMELREDIQEMKDILEDLVSTNSASAAPAISSNTEPPPPAPPAPETEAPPPAAPPAPEDEALPLLGSVSVPEPEAAPEPAAAPAPEQLQSSLFEVAPLYDSYATFAYDVKEENNIKMGGVTYKEAITYATMYESHYGCSLHNLNGQWSVLSGYLGHMDDTGLNNATVTFYGDDEIIETYDLSADDLPVYITIDVKNIRQLKVYLENTGNYDIYGGKYGFADVVLE